MRGLKNIWIMMRKTLRDGLRLVKEHYDLIFPSALALPVQHKRIAIIQARIRALAWLLAITMPLWGILDSIALPHDLWVSILPARILAGVGLILFLAVGKKFIKRSSNNLWLIYLQFIIIFVIPMTFYVFCRRLPEPVFEVNSFATSITNSYYLLPLVVMACIGFFPLTLLESTAIAAPLFTAYYMNGQDTNASMIPADLGMAWIMAMLGLISTVISYSQLRMVIKLVNYSSYDVLTDCLGRRSGEEVIETLWHYSVRNNTNLSVAFVDLDHFKHVNDTFGHQVGDAVLSHTASMIKRSLRKSDFVIRWGGEEFLVVMPDASIDNATSVLSRMAIKGFGARPDGSQQTVSIGIAERINDKTNDEDNLIKIADTRLYQAKTDGRSRAVGAKTILLKE